jgi:drug/metabolite transporter (DMT)-like permease
MKHATPAPASPTAQPTEPPLGNQVRGILLKLLSVAVFSAMAACIKAAREDVPAGETVFFRAFLALVPVLAWAAYTRHLRDAVVTRNLRGHFWRGLVGGCSMGLSFAALGLLPLPEAIAISFASPLLATVLAVFLLGEVVRLYRWTAVLVGLVGVLVMVWPRMTMIGTASLTDGATLGAALALVAAFLTALAQIHVRWLTRTEPTIAIVFWFHVTVSVGSLATIPFGWVWPDGTTWTLLIAAGLCGGVAQILVTASYRLADASTIAPFDYSSMLYGLAIGFFVFGEVPDWLVIAGSGIVIASGLFILERERRLGLMAAKARVRPGMTPQG